MYTVVFAEDEEEIRSRILKKIRWNELGFEVVGDADNGLTALEMVEKLEPDLLITDIKMPFLNGIELARKVREIRPSVQIVFLSGFDEFTYAQQAIQYNVISYILKPITAVDLEEELRKIKKTIDDKFEQFSRTHSLSERVEKTEFMLPLLLDDSGKKQEEKFLLKQAVSCGFVSDGDYENLRYAVLVTSLFDGENNCTTPANVNAVDMILKKYVHYISCYINGRVVSIIAAPPRGLTKYLHILVEEIVQSVERIMCIQCSIGISSEMETIGQCRKAYLEAMNALSYSRKKVSNVHFISDEEQVTNINQEVVLRSVSTVEELLRGGTLEEMNTFLYDFSEKVSNGEISPVLADFLVVQIAAAVFRVIYSALGDEFVRMLQKEYRFEKYNLVEKTLESFGACEELCIKAKELLVEQRKKTSDVICDKACEIIRNNYMDSELSLEMIANEVGVTANYLSAVIRKTTGNTFGELVSYHRIEKAKELLTCTSMKIREVSELCGYSEQHYFSYCFKKATGISPNQCRRMSQGEA